LRSEHLDSKGDDVIDLEALRARVVGYRFPDGQFTIPPHEAWLAADALHSPPLPEGVAHPMYFYYVGLVGMGISLDELFALVDSSASDGPMFGELEINQGRALRVGEQFRVTGEILSVDRKEGGSGVFDIVTFRLDLHDAAGNEVGGTVNSFIFPRRS
jgi:acyl dehydratase